MPEFLRSLQPHLIGFGIGFIVGMERERSHPPGDQAMGVRTFALFGILGAVAGTAGPGAIEDSLAAFVVGAVLTSYYRGTRRRKGRAPDIGLTTEAAAIGVFALGHLAPRDARLAVALGALMLAVLAGRNALHRFTRELLRADELQAFISLVVLAVGVLPLLPDRPFGPWMVFNPFRFTALLTALASIQFLSHAALRVFGERMGLPLAGFLAGLVSSTAAFVSLRKDARGRGWIAYGAMACIAMTLQFAAILWATSFELLRSVGAGVGGALAVLVAGTVVAGRSSSPRSGRDAGRGDSPLNWKSLILSAVALFLVLALTTIVSRRLGSEGLWLATFLSGLFELHGVTYAVASSVADVGSARIALVLAFIAALASKVALLATASGPWKGTARLPLVGLLLLCGLAFGAGAALQ